MAIEKGSEFYRVLTEAVTDALIDRYGTETWYHMSAAEKQSIITKTVNKMTENEEDSNDF